MIEEGLFRKDLYYRLQVLTVEIPPLRDRLEDVVDLAEAFLIQAAEVNGEEPKTLSRDAKKSLAEYTWLGNIRELKNVIQRVAVLSKTDVVDKETLETAIYSKGYAFKSENKSEKEAEVSETEDSLESRFREVYRSHRELLEEALRLADGNKTKAAELLGVTRQTIYRLMKKYSIEE